ncbi:hypothetical protein FWH13_01775 [Candidatus Saccharibacteria bacterium]|nr:hypothetical protein [Candidatus Saccharibacteria bacterium]
MRKVLRWLSKAERLRRKDTDIINRSDPESMVSLKKIFAMVILFLFDVALFFLMLDPIAGESPAFVFIIVAVLILAIDGSPIMAASYQQPDEFRIWRARFKKWLARNNPSGAPAPVQQRAVIESTAPAVKKRTWRNRNADPSTTPEAATSSTERSASPLTMPVRPLNMDGEIIAEDARPLQKQPMAATLDKVTNSMLLIAAIVRAFAVMMSQYPWLHSTMGRTFENTPWLAVGLAFLAAQVFGILCSASLLVTSRFIAALAAPMFNPFNYLDKFWSRKKSALERECERQLQEIGDPVYHRVVSDDDINRQCDSIKGALSTFQRTSIAQLRSEFEAHRLAQDKLKAEEEEARKLAEAARQSTTVTNPSEEGFAAT